MTPDLAALVARIKQLEHGYDVLRTALRRAEAERDSALSHAAATVERLRDSEEQCDALRHTRDILLRIRDWDMFGAAADGPYWRREIDAAIDAALAQEGK